VPGHGLLQHSCQEHGDRGCWEFSKHKVQRLEALCLSNLCGEYIALVNVKYAISNPNVKSEHDSAIYKFASLICSDKIIWF
jgi:hypothetical protein